jgi:hypothetical protein
LNLDTLLLGIFAAGVAVGAWRMARRDALYAGFFVFFFVYTFFAMLGYRYFPILSVVMNAYFGPELFRPYLLFVGLSFVSFWIFFRLTHGLLVGNAVGHIRYAPNAVVKWICLGIATAGIFWMAITLSRIYPAISYSAIPQIPNFAYAFAFKNSIFVILLLLAFARHHAATGFEKVAATALVVVLGIVFMLTALKSSNRTDILALLLGLVWYEAGPHLFDRNWRFRPRVSLQLALKATLLAVVGWAAMTVMIRISGSRPASDGVALPLYARVLMNDYYAPAHILFGAMAFDYVRPLLVAKSNLANALMLGGLLKIPYLQTEIGNLLIPGSSSRSTGFAYFIFTEGFMALGRWGILYNGLVPVVAIALWRRLGRSSDLRYNAFVGALCAMSFATVARSGNHLLLRVYLFNLIPYLMLFRAVTGARWATSSAPRRTPVSR